MTPTPIEPAAHDVVHPSDGPVTDDRVLADTARLRAVEALGLLDTGDEQPFDRWAVRATELTRAGSALLSLVDERRSFFKSFQHSDGTAGEQREVPISMSLCREVVVRGESLIVEDAANDPRTRDYGAVAAFPVGAYAGVPLRSEDGSVLGSFCVVDSAPRAWTPSQMSALDDLAAATQAELQLRAAGHQNRRQAELMNAHQRVHALMLDGTPRRAVLAEFVSGVERQFGGMRGSILLGEDLGLGDEGPRARAARTGADVIDLLCWAVPILGSNGLPLGALALRGETPRTPYEDDMALLHQAARLAAIVLERDGASVELVRLATTDALTGLPNRAWLIDQLGVRLAAEAGVRDTAVLFCDLDGFKRINDSHGHQIGDGVLIEIARRIAAEVRPGDLVARLGGDEFVVVPGGVHAADSAAECARRLEQALAAPIPLPDGATLVVHASVGVALVDGVGAEEALRRSDVAMYDVKGTATRVRVFESDVDGEACQRRRVLEALRREAPVDHEDPGEPRRAGAPAMGWLVAATALILAVYAADILLGVLPAGLSELFTRFALPLVFAGAAGQCALRARAAGSEASAWWLFSLALAVWGAGSLYYGVVLWEVRVVPLPSPADGLWIMFYVVAYAALFRLLRSRVGAIRGRLGLDAAIGALATAGVLAAVTLPNILEQGDHTTAAFLTIASYPLGDIGLLAAVVGSVSVVGLKGQGPWRLVALAFAIFVVADSVYLVQVAQGTFRPGGVVDLGWPLAAILLGAAAWRTGDGSRPRSGGDPTVALPAASGLLALGLLTYDHFSRVHIAALVLASATIAVVLLRLLQAVRSNQRLVGGLTSDIAERRRVTAILDRSEARLRKTEEMVGSGSWELSLDGETMTWSDGFLRVYGFAPGAAVDLEALNACVHPEDRAAMDDAVARCITSGRATSEHRITRPDGSVRTLLVEGELVAPEEDRPGCLRGGLLDVTDERAAFDAAPMGMLLAEPKRLRLLRVNDALCSMLGRTREDLVGRTIQELTHPGDRAQEARQHQILMTAGGGPYQAEKRYLRPDGSVVWTAIYVTPVHAADDSVRAFSCQVIDITERKNRAAEIQTARVDSLRRLAIASEYRDNDTHEHTERVGHVAQQIGRMLGVTEARLDLLRQAAPLHDIGKIGISDLILLKPGALTPHERETMERHTLIGADILSGSDSPVLQMAEEIALTHHERWDGEGYPHRLRGEDIPLLGRIVAIADVFDALTHARPYKEAWSVDRTVEHIRGMSGSQFDPDVVAAFSALHHTSLYSFKPPGGPVAGTSRHAEPAEQPRGRGLFVAADEEHVTDRDDAAADRDRAASARDHTAAERDRREAEADRRTSDRDDAASDRDHAAAVRDLVALAREQAASARDRAPGDAGRRASDRDDAAADRDHAAADSRETASDRDQAQLGADERLANRDRAAVDRVLAASDRDQTAADRRAATIDRDAARDQLRRAQIDQLTGALGRGLGMVTLGREINRARHGNGKLVLAFVEVEGLTQVNDRHGRAAGDLLLQQVVAAMQASLRSYDPIVRFGGDEFVCALVDAGPADVDRRFDEVRAKLALAHPGASIRVGLVALRPGDTLDHLTERGDAALHRAKRSRR